MIIINTTIDFVVHVIITAAVREEFRVIYVIHVHMSAGKSRYIYEAEERNHFVAQALNEMIPFISVMSIS